IALLWAASGFFMVLQSALTLAVPGRRTRSVLAQRMVAVVSIFTLGPLILLLMVTGVLITALADVPGLEVAQRVSGSLLPLVGAFALFSLAYRFLPAHSPGWRASLLGAAPAAVAWQLARTFLHLIMPKVTYAAYGTLANFLLLLAWLYLSMEILLMGGVLTAMIERRDYLPLESRLDEPPPPS
ncbi:MAG TPA: YhjD/YihY/BrkB family envelope integrity protein, partial [Deinococcales bacterium]|nr:YhjD/YihY/BrkB family envelope integrity protein [Deinococcales bacterium]